MVARRSAVVTALCGAAAGLGVAQGRGSVTRLNDGNFDRAISNGPHFVKFYAPWCSHSKEMEPIWIELAKTVAQSPITIAEVDCTADAARCSQSEVEGYPTLKLFSSGKPAVEYTGGRSLIGMEQFVSEHGGQFQSAGPVGSAPGGEVYRADDSTFKELVSKGVTFVKFFAPWCGHCKAMAPTWIELAESYAHDSSVTIAEVDCTSAKDACSSTGVRGYPSLLLFFDGVQVAKYEGGRTLDGFRSFISDRTSGASNSADDDLAADAEVGTIDGLAELTDANFGVAISTGATFVKFYAPWCGHCRRLAPVWEELATTVRYSQRSGVTIGRLDCTANAATCKSIKVTSYPTLRLYQDGDLVKAYDQGRDLKSFRAFLDDHIESIESAPPKPNAHEHEEL